MSLIASLFMGACSSAAPAAQTPAATAAVPESPPEEVPEVEAAPLWNPRAAEATASGIFADQSILGTLDLVGDRMYAIGETSGSLEDWDGVLLEAAAHISEHGADPANAAELTTPGDQHEMTPLVYASRMGYHPIVEALLAFESVRQRIENPDRNGMSAWQVANLGERLAALLLNPNLPTNVFAFIPFMVTTPYYGDAEFSPYHRTRRLLEAAGAATDIAPVQAYVEQAPYCAPEVKQEVRNTEDVLTTLRTIALSDWPHGLQAVLERMGQQ